MLRIWLVALVVVAVMGVVKGHHVLQRAGLTGYCTAATGPAGSAGSWRACHAGRLSGAPDLSRASCHRAVRVGKVAFWRCPENVASSPVAGS